MRGETNHRERENRQKLALWAIPDHIAAPRGAHLRPNGAQVAQACMVMPAGCCLCYLCEPSQPSFYGLQSFAHDHDGAQRLKRPPTDATAISREAAYLKASVNQIAELLLLAFIAARSQQCRQIAVVARTPCSTLSSTASWQRPLGHPSRPRQRCRRSTSSTSPSGPSPGSLSKARR